MQTENSIIYEQPCDELMRIFLRLEYLFRQIDNALNYSNIDDSCEIVISYLIAILSLLDRLDIKGKITKKLHDYHNYFSQLTIAPNVDKVSLNKVLKQLRELNDYYLSLPGKLGHELRDDELIARIRQNFVCSGDCSAEIPMYSYYLNQPAESKEQYLVQCLDKLHNLRKTIDILLKITRDSGEFVTANAENGFYHQTLDASKRWQLLRIAVPRSEAVYPEISAGRHRMNVRFVTADLNSSPQQSKDAIPFYVSCCAV